MLVKKFVLSLIIAGISWFHLSAQNPILSAKASEILTKSDEVEVSVLLFFKNQFDVESFRNDQTLKAQPLGERTKTLLQELHNTRDASSTIFGAWLENNQTSETKISLQTHFWLVNMALVKTNLRGLQALSNCQLIEKIELENEKLVRFIEPVSMQAIPEGTESVNGIEPGIANINARFMWNLGYTGRNRKNLTIDTGVWPEVPALINAFEGTYKPLSQSWLSFDAIKPYDKPSNHGTHVTGTIVGLAPQTNDTIGAAFNATFMASDPLTTQNLTPFTVIIHGFQWALNPDGNLATTDDIPDVINNSYGLAGAVDTTFCNNYVSQMLETVVAAGMAVVFSAGNDGPGLGTVTQPQFINKSLVNVFSIGSINANLANLPISNFSSRGPSACGGTGSLNIKPEVVAPGENVRSSVKVGYANFSGTSMASPHVSSAILLLKEAFPYLSGEDLMLALYHSAIDMGDPGEDNTFGKGRINCENAYNYLIGLNHNPVPPINNSYSAQVKSMTDIGANCSETAIYRTVVVNNGTQTLTNLNLSYTAGTQTQTVNFPTLVPNDSIVHLSNGFQLQNGFNEVSVKVTHDSMHREFFIADNHKTSRKDHRGTFLMPFSEGFEANQTVGNKWLIENPDQGLTWERVEKSHFSNSSFAASVNCRNYAGNGQLDALVSPRFKDFIVGPNQRIEFDLAYRSAFSFRSDSLFVQVKGSCNGTWQTVWQNGGAGMYTFTGSQAIDSSSYQHIVIPLGALSNDTIQVRFLVRNGNGGEIIIDNVVVKNGLVNVSEQNLLKFEVYPNPTNNVVQIKGEQLNGKVLNVRNNLGQLVQTRVLNNQNQIDLFDLKSGVYFLEIRGFQAQKLVKF